MLEAHWVGFHDPQSTLREFRWCVGSSRGVCDVTTMSTSLLERRVTATGLTLPVATPLYVTVVAENGAGLKTQAESDSFMGMWFVCWLLNVLATCECISGTDLLRQFYVLPH